MQDAARRVLAAVPTTVDGSDKIIWDGSLAGGDQKVEVFKLHNRRVHLEIDNKIPATHAATWFAFTGPTRSGPWTQLATGVVAANTRSVEIDQDNGAAWMYFTMTTPGDLSLVDSYLTLT
jgi:hypothetical protein